MKISAPCHALVVAASLLGASAAQAEAVSFTKLTGSTGGVPALTAVFRADLSALSTANIASITIEDVSGGFGGAAGQFSGFDLDAIKLSTTLCADAACASAAVGLSVFDFLAGTVFVPGTQRAPVDPKLFGTDAAGTGVDNAVATLGAFDGNATTAIPGADGFISMGDFGRLSFNLTSIVAAAGLYLYIGEVGDNGEVAGSNVTVSSTPVPTPATLGLVVAALAAAALARRRA
jgi:MYXO-CTERM domain-containing protein